MYESSSSTHELLQGGNKLLSNFSLLPCMFCLSHPYQSWHMPYSAEGVTQTTPAVTFRDEVLILFLFYDFLQASITEVLHKWSNWFKECLDKVYSEYPTNHYCALAISTENDYVLKPFLLALGRGFWKRAKCFDAGQICVSKHHLNQYKKAHDCCGKLEGQTKSF